MAPRKDPDNKPTEAQEANEAKELAVAERTSEGEELSGQRARLQEIKDELDAALGHFENTADAHSFEAAVTTIDSVKNRLDAIRTLAADAITALDE